MSGLRDLPLLFVDDLDAPALADADLHHFRRVLRVADGAAIAIGDGNGRWRAATFAPAPEPTGPIHEEPPSPDPVTVAFAPVKGTKPEWVVQKLTELGVDRIVPVITERTVVRWGGDRKRSRQDRLASAAREACLQCRRVRRPVIDEPMALGAFLGAEPSAVVADPDGGPPSGGDRIVVVGPEGGFTADEIAARRTVRLPGHVLRAETAVVVAAASVVALRAGLAKSISM